MAAAAPEPTPDLPWLVYHPRYQCLVCLPCQAGVAHPGLAGHLQAKHQAACPPPLRRAIVARYAGASLRRSDAYGAADLPRPEDLPVAGVQWWRDGLACARCPAIYRDLRQIQAHCKAAHGWGAHYRAGRYQSDRDPPCWRTGVAC